MRERSGQNLQCDKPWGIEQWIVLPRCVCKDLQFDSAQESLTHRSEIRVPVPRRPENVYGGKITSMNDNAYPGKSYGPRGATKFENALQPAPVPRFNFPAHWNLANMPTWNINPSGKKKGSVGFLEPGLLQCSCLTHCWYQTTHAKEEPRAGSVSGKASQAFLKSVTVVAVTGT